MKRLMLLFVLCVAMAGEAAAADTWVNCTPVNIATYASRVHVRCSAATAGILYFAVSASDTAFAQRFVSIGTSALISGRTLQVFYDTADTSGAAFGCASNDCRRAKALVIQ